MLVAAVVTGVDVVGTVVTGVVEVSASENTINITVVHYYNLIRPACILLT